MGVDGTAPEPGPGDLRAVRAAIAAALAGGGNGDPGSAAGAVGRVCVAALPVDGASFTAMTSDQSRDLLCASDAVIAQTSALQFGFGEGPILEAFTTARPVLVPDVAAIEAVRWPVFTPALAALPVGGLFVFPVAIGAIILGVFELYRQVPGRLSTGELSTVLSVTDLAGSALLAARAGSRAGELDGAWLDGTGTDRRVHQATGMLIAQLEVPAQEAFARLRGYAFAHDQRIGTVAEDILTRGLRLDHTPD